MKNILKTVVLMATAAIWFAGCKKDENRNFFLGGKAPNLVASKVDVVLTPATEANEAIKFSWTNPDYQFSTGLSSHDVQYALEFDVNQAFTSANKFVTTISKDLSKAFTVFEFNQILGNSMLLPLDQNVTVYARVKSSLRFEGAVNGELISNTVTIRTKPYAPPPAVDPPASGRLWMVGSATPNDWNNPTVAAQEFTRVSNTLYEITIRLNANGSFLMLPVNGSWDIKYGWAGANNANNVTGDKMQMGGGDIKAPATTGNYKVSANFQSGRFTITPQ